MKKTATDMEAADVSSLDQTWPSHRPADLIDRVIVEHWLDAQVAALRPLRSLGAAAGPSPRPSS